MSVEQTPYVPTAIYTLLTSESAPAGLQTLLGDPMRVFPVRMAESSEYPAVVYTELDETTTGSKDGDVITSYSLMVIVYATGYLEGQNIARLTRRALNQKTIQVEVDTDDVDDGPATELQNFKLHFKGKSDLDFEDTKDILGIGLSFRAVRTA